MREGIKYPYIGEGYVSGVIVLMASDSKGVAINDLSPANNKGDWWDSWNECQFKNITREHLANTYGKVESKEHAEFIIELAKNADLVVILALTVKSATFTFLYW